MPRTEYSTIQIPKITKLKIENFKKRHGYPSYSQAVTALVERGDVSDDIKATLVEELRRTLSEEAGTIMLKSMYQLFFDVLRRSNKPLSKMTLGNVIDIMREMESEERKQSFMTNPTSVNQR